MGGGGERRRRIAELQFAPPPVATRNGLARPRPEARPGCPKTTQTVKTKPLENRKCPENHPQILLQTRFYERWRKRVFREKQSILWLWLEIGGFGRLMAFTMLSY